MILSPVPMINHEVSGGEYASRKMTDNFEKVIVPVQKGAEGELTG